MERSDMAPLEWRAGRKVVREGAPDHQVDVGWGDAQRRTDGHDVRPFEDVPPWEILTDMQAPAGQATVLEFGRSRRLDRAPERRSHHGTPVDQRRECLGFEGRVVQNRGEGVPQDACAGDQTVNELPHPQPPLALGFRKVKPCPMKLVT